MGDRATVAVRWRASDADGDPLDATLDLSTDGGRTFHNVWAGPSGDGVARVRTELLSATGAARLRLGVSDGFRETTTTSARFTVVGRRPQVQILEPVPNQRGDAGGAVRLRGAAVDDHGRQLAGRRLRWLAGRTVLGRGTTVSAALPAGARSVRLEATDAAGRTGSASVALRVRATTPFFVRLSAPRVARTARTAVLVVSATQPSTLDRRGRHHRVGPKARRITGVHRGVKQPVRLRLTLAAGGRRSVPTVVVNRRGGARRRTRRTLLAGGPVPRLSRSVSRPARGQDGPHGDRLPRDRHHGRAHGAPPARRRASRPGLEPIAREGRAAGRRTAPASPRTPRRRSTALTSS